MNHDHVAVVQRVRARVADGLSAATEAANGAQPMAAEDRRAYAGELVAQELRGVSQERMGAGHPRLSRVDEDSVRRAVLDALFGLGPLQQYVDDTRIANIELNGCSRAWIQWNGGDRQQIEPPFATNDELVHFVRNLITGTGNRWERTNPSVSVNLPGIGRLFAEAWVGDEPSMVLRRLAQLYSLDQLQVMGTLTPEVRHFLECAVLARANMVVSGAPNAGKTTGVGALALRIPYRERVICVEDPIEIGVRLREDVRRNIVCKEVQHANAEGQGELTAAWLMRRALHQNGDRIIVSEVRGDEVLVFLVAARSTQRGSLTTVHADVSRGALRQLQLYALNAPQRLDFRQSAPQIAAAVDLVVHMVHLPTTHPTLPGVRVVSSILALAGDDGEGGIAASEVFAPGHDGRALPATGLTGPLRERMAAAGLDLSVLRNGHLPADLGARPGGWQ